MKAIMIQFIVVGFLFSPSGKAEERKQKVLKDFKSASCSDAIDKSEKEADPKTIIGKEILLTVVNSNLDSCTAELVLLLNEEDEALGAKLKYVSKNDRRAPRYYQVKQFNGSMVLKEVYSKSKIYKAVILKGKNFQQHAKTFFKVDYLSNGLTGSRGDIDVALDYANGTWGLYHKGSKVKKFFFKKKTIFGKVVGIKKIEVQY